MIGNSYKLYIEQNQKVKLSLIDLYTWRLTDVNNQSIYYNDFRSFLDKNDAELDVLDDGYLHISLLTLLLIRLLH